MARMLQRILPIISRATTFRSPRHGQSSIYRFSTKIDNGDAFGKTPTQKSKFSLQFDDRFLRIAFPANPHTTELQINALWLRDHCRCSICYNSDTDQRSADIVSLKNQSTITETLITKGDSDSDSQISVTWNDGHRSIYDIDWIRQNWLTPRRPQIVESILWSGRDLKSKHGGLPKIDYRELIEGKNESKKRLLDKVISFGVACVTNAPASFEETSRLCETVALPEETVYGKFWKFSAANMDHADTAYSNLGLGAHTDLTYYSQTAGVQVFHLLEHTDGEGGSTLLVDGFHVAEQLRKIDPSAFKFLASNPIPCHYLDAGSYFFSEEPVLKVHPSTDELIQFRFNIYDRAPLNTFRTNEEVERFYRSYTALAELVRREENEFWIKLEPGTIVFIDNFRVMHGRSAFTGKRVMCGCYLQRDSFLSNARNLHRA